MKHIELQTSFDQYQCCIVMATYNNAGTLSQMIEDILAYTSNLIIVNDGSTDQTSAILENYAGQFTIVDYSPNQGKGWALQKGFAKARELNYQYCLSIDSDGQHFAIDLPKFINRLTEAQNPILILGNRNMNQEGIPSKSSFGNRFSNFWFWVETGKKQADTQTGYRLYPISEYDKMKFFTKRFEFEIEILIRSAWKNIEIDSVDINVKYFEGEERISHFRPFKDFFRISVLNSVLTTWALLYIKPRNFVLYFVKNDIKKIFKEQLTAHNESPEKLSFTLGFGVFMGIIPIWGFQMVVAFFLAQLMKLNKTLVILAANISLPPIVPFIIFGSYWLGGLLLGDPNIDALFDSFKNINDGSFKEAFNDMGYNFYQYIIGAFALALVSGLITFGISYLLLKLKERSISPKV